MGLSLLTGAALVAATMSGMPAGLEPGPATYPPRAPGEVRTEVPVPVQPGEPAEPPEPAVQNKPTKPTVQNKKKPRVKGTPRFTRTLTATRGKWKGGGKVRVRYRWLRNGEPIKGRLAKKRRYRLQAADVGQRLRVRVTAKRKGFTRAVVKSKGVRVKHRIPVRRVVTYRVETRGPINTSLRVFRRQARETFADPRGWRNAGVEFREVRRGGQFSLVLSAASHVRGFSSMCSSYYSCRVGRHVVINQDRWKWATPSWRAARGTLRGYRHMVVNHETGHWLGHGHRGCPGKGPAPVMMQQSKGLGGCTHNPWPIRSELWTR